MKKIEKIVLPIIAGLIALGAGMVPLADYLSYKNKQDNETAPVELPDEDDEEEEEDLGPQYNTINYYRTFGAFDETQYFRADNNKSFNPRYKAHIYEAESAQITNRIQIETNENCSNGHNLGYLYSGETVTYTINSLFSGTVLLTCALATGPDDTTGRECNGYFSLTCNDEYVNTDDCWIEPTFGWTNYSESQIATLEFKEGANTLVFTTMGDFNFDYFTITPRKVDVPESTFEYSSPLTIPVKETTVQGCQLSTDLSCIEYVNDSTTLKWNVTSEAKITCYLYVRIKMQRYSNVDGNTNVSERFEITINGRQLYLSQTEVFSYVGEWWMRDYVDLNLGLFALKEGKNSFLFTSIQYQYNIESFKVVTR